MSGPGEGALRVKATPLATLPSLGASRAEDPGGFLVHLLPPPPRLWLEPVEFPPSSFSQKEMLPVPLTTILPLCCTMEI